MTRREFISRSAIAATGVAIGGTAVAAHSLRATEVPALVPRLPPAFEGVRVALISDLHHGIFFSLESIARAIERAEAFQPDLVLLLGDYVYRDRGYIAPAIGSLAKLSAPLGVYAVLGNHDNEVDRTLTQEELARNEIPELTNTGQWLTRENDRIFLAGIDDLWTGMPNLDLALRDADPEGCTLLMSHNPDIIEHLDPSQASFVFAGHTHGGQVHIPGIGSPVVPSKFGQKYRYGLVKGPAIGGYVTCGVGCVFPPVRFDCEAEVACLTLHALTG